MRLLILTAAAIAFPAAVFASCSSYPDWESAQRALEMGDRSLDGGIGPREPDGIACEGNPGYPGDRMAEHIAQRIQKEIQAEEERRKQEEDALDNIESNDDARRLRDRLGVRTDVTCDNFTTQAEAQAQFDENPLEYPLLDPDGDGLACEGGSSTIPRDGGPQGEYDRRPEGSKPFYLNTWEEKGTGVAPRKGLSTSQWPGTPDCPKHIYSTSRTGC